MSHSLQLLVVQKNQQSIDSLEEVIESLSFQLLATVNDMQQAHFIIEQENPDLVIFRCEQGDITGSGVLTDLCQRKRIPFLFLFCESAGKKESSESDKAITKSPTFLLAHPLSPSHLINASFSEMLRLSKGIIDETTGVQKVSVELRNYFFLRSGQSLVKVPVKDFLYIKSDGNYSTIYTIGQRYMLRITMGKLLRQLPPQQFARVHRQYIVHLEKIDEILLADNMISISYDDVVLPVGRKYREALKKRLPQLL